MGLLDGRWSQFAFCFFLSSIFSCLKCGYKCLKWNEAGGREEADDYTLKVAEWKERSWGPWQQGGTIILAWNGDLWTAFTDATNINIDTTTLAVVLPVCL